MIRDVRFFSSCSNDILLQIFPLKSSVLVNKMILVFFVVFVVAHLQQVAAATAREFANFLTVWPLLIGQQSLSVLLINVGSLYDH